MAVVIDPAMMKIGLIMFAVASVVAIGFGIIAKYRESLSNVADGDDPETLLESFREAYEAGEIDEEEFKRICLSLGQPGPIDKIPHVPRF